MHKAMPVCAALVLLAGCATTSNEYVVDERWIVDPQQVSEAIKASANASAAAHAYAAGEQGPTVVHTVAPKMPREALEKGIEGAVRVLLLVDHKGHVSEVKVLESPSILLSEAVVTAMKQWRFTPRLVNGTPQSFTAEQTYEFRAGG